ncbi:hypothetical protein RAC83_000308 [Xylella fastidiosa]|nr:hypothetical protein [Xylella fastidiosa]
MGITIIVFLLSVICYLLSVICYLRWCVEHCVTSDLGNLILGSVYQPMGWF